MKYLKLSILTLFTLSAVSAMASESILSIGANKASTPTITSDFKVKSNKKEIKGPNMVSLGTGAYLGYNQRSLKVGRFLNYKNLVQAVYSFHNDKDVEEINEAKTTGKMISVSNKYFFKDSFYVSGTLYYSKNDINVPEGKILKVRGTSIKEPVLENYGVGVSLGNHFFGSKGFSLGIDWIGYSTEVVKVQKIDGIKEGNLTFLNIAIGYNF